MPKVVAPSIKETAFSCPHCHALTSQTWFGLRAEATTGAPSLHTREFAETVRNDENMDGPLKDSLVQWIEAAAAGQVLIEKGDGKTSYFNVTNVHLSQCYNCAKVAVWVHDRLVHPANQIGVPPNPDLPAEIAADFAEARSIVDNSPRGAAALLRLCVQKLCRHLGQPGRSIDDDIAALVRTGLNPLVRKSLDIVRVIGNEAVHPGTIDLKDDRDTALRLFELVNAIAEGLISHPKSVEALYDKLPEAKRRGIERRDQLADK